MFLKISFVYLFVFLSAAACTRKEESNAQTSVQKTQAEAACVQLGEELVVSGGSPGRWTFSRPCCEGLASISQPEDAKQGAAPGRMICASCGDGKCDPKYENALNCGDCK